MAAASSGNEIHDRSGTITTGGAAQTLMAANPSRCGFAIQNLSNGDIWINEMGSAAVGQQPSIKIPAGGLYEAPWHGCSREAISIIGATTGQAFTAREWW